MPPPPPPPSYQPAPVIEPPAAPAWWKKKRWKLPTWAWIAIGVVLIGAAASGGSKKKDEPAADKPTQTTTPVTTGQPAVAAAVTTVAETAPPTEAPVTTVEETTTTIEQGTSRDNPWTPGDTLTLGDYNPLQVAGMEFVTNETILAANQFNTEATAEQTYVRVPITATYTGSGTGSAFDLATGAGLVGDKGKIYTIEFIAEGSGGSLEDLLSAPDVITGGVLSGYLYFLADTDDMNLMLTFQTVDGRRFIDVSP